MAIFRNIKTNHLYRHHGENKYTNLSTGSTGEIKEETAQRLFKINMEATAIFNEYPLAEELVKRLHLIDGRNL